MVQKKELQNIHFGTETKKRQKAYPKEVADAAEGKGWGNSWKSSPKILDRSNSTMNS